MTTSKTPGWPRLAPGALLWALWEAHAASAANPMNKEVNKGRRRCIGRSSQVHDESAGASVGAGWRWRKAGRSSDLPRGGVLKDRAHCARRRAGARGFGPSRERLTQIRSLEDPNPADVFLGLGVRTIGDVHGAIGL